jgi:hypothetical protein
MKKIIVTTTINPPTEALIEFSKMEDWNLLVVGDQKTPHQLYKNLKCDYLHPEEQSKLYPKLSELIGWNCIQRRTIGIVKAFKDGADVIALVDDDNIPFANWNNILVGKEITTTEIISDDIAIDPLYFVDKSDELMWHRGFPHELLKNRHKYTCIENIQIKCLVQANLWTGAPDVDAIYRMINPNGEIFNQPELDPITSRKQMPFNSQNTILDRSIIPYYYLLPGLGRFDDIWASYMLQKELKDHLPFIVFDKPTVCQERNIHNIHKDLKAELYGYEHNLELINGDWSVLTDQAKKTLDEYKRIIA